jgi:hypothetical protein
MKPGYILFAILALSSLAVGCNSGRYPVSGQITYEDGAPVTAGTIIAEATIDGKVVGLQANINPDGKFTLGGANPGDGALPGSYRVLVTTPTISDAEKALGKKPQLDGKYGRFESSGLTLEVKSGKNELPIKVARPKGDGDGA